MQIDHRISETAFLVNEWRAQLVELSQDLYAHLWTTPSTRQLTDEFEATVNPHDGINCALRNRYFLDRIRAFVEAHPSAVFVNVAAGFTSYPFLIAPCCESIEIDYPHVMDWKRTKIREWQRAGVLPSPALEFIGADLNQEADRQRLTEMLQVRLRGRPSFILFEGITYYLEMPILRHWFEICRAVQEPGSVLAQNSWMAGSETHPKFLRLEKFFRERLGLGNQRYNLFDGISLRNVPGYELAELTTIAAQERVYCTTNILEDPNAIIPLELALLRRVTE
ncbi:MAG: class I SAM-dependent methyltransferase [Deltaproteobacteria bacterium]|nr:class I SAM-dependent methyltransferase [Deltaproteobacteria bacterium]